MIDYKALEHDGQMIAAVEKRTREGRTAGEIYANDHLGLQYEQIERIQRRYQAKTKKKGEPPTGK